MDYSKYYRKLEKVAKQLQLPVPELGAGVAGYWPFLEVIRGRGGVVLLKLDGERRGPDDNGPYTAMVSGDGLPQGEFFRTDAPRVEDALTYVIACFFDGPE